MPEDNIDNTVETNEAEVNESVAPKEAPKENSVVDIPENVLNQKIAEALKPIKEKLDNAYSARDEALSKVAEFEQKEKEAQLARLQEEGKYKEAYEMQLAEEKARREALEKRNVELTRDIDVNSELAKYDFRTAKAKNMAFQEVISDLVQNENGVWVHKSGVSVSDFVRTFSESDDNAFLFKQKASSGAGTITPTPSNPSATTSNSLYSMSQDEVLRLAAEGKLRK